MIAITIDCEQWNASELRSRKSDANTKYSLEGNKKLLNIFKRHNIHATFFVTGFFAEKEKKQTKEISKNHEVASHGYNHFYRGNTELNLKEDIMKSKAIIEKVIKKKVVGFRAPQMQFSKELIKILEKNNFKYDSSIHSAYLPGYYNNRKMPLKLFKIGKITEIPASASYFLRLPFNWMFMRNLPLFYTIRVVKKLIKKGITPILYFHSWEFVKIKDDNVPFYLTRNTGDVFCRKLENFLKYFKNEKFVKMESLVNER